MIFSLSVTDRSGYYGLGYIAGTGDGIVTVAGVPASRAIYLFATGQHTQPALIKKTWSNPNGNYLFDSLKIDADYIVMVRDYKKEYEPFVWDYVKPADDLTIAEQQALRQSWQIN